MDATGTITLVAFLMASSLVLLISLLAGGRKSRLDSRLEGLAGKASPAPDPDPVAQFARSALPKMGTALMPSDEGERTRLQARLVQAGLYGRQAMVLFLGVKMLLMIAPALVGLTAGAMG